MKKVALITGGNKGIGLEVSKYFLNNNFKVIVIARDFKRFELSANNNLKELSYDLSDPSGIPELISSLEPIDVLVNNAGAMLSLPYDNYPQESVTKILKLNIESPVALMREVAKSMKIKKSGRIINNASIAGQIGHPDIWYGISKAALINATKSFAKILGPDGILVNCVAASPVDTDMLDVIPESRKTAFKKSTILNRFATAKEVAGTIGWLGTISPKYINGSCIDINNGSYPR